MLIIGIDPGISGSICFFEDGKILDVIDMPTMTEGKKNKRQVNGSQIYNEILKRIDKAEKKETLLLLFVCRKWVGTPQNMENQELNWVKAVDLNQFKMPPANLFLNSILRDWLVNY